MKNTLLALGTITFVIAAIAISFLVNAGLIWVVCWGFGWTFTWKLAVGIYVAEIILKSIFNNVSKKD